LNSGEKTKGVLRRIKSHLLEFERKSYVHNYWRELRKREMREKELLDCSIGENPFGCSPLVRQALKEVEHSDIEEYPKQERYSKLKERIAEYWSEVANVRHILLGAGSMYVLERINLLFLGEGKKVLGYCPQFTEYIIEARLLGARHKCVLLPKEKGFKFDVEMFLDEINDSFDLIYIDNPNNPTGQTIVLKDVEEIVRKASGEDVVVIVDEAYGEFMEKKESALGLINVYDNLIVVRSFSKGFGLPGLRVGYAVCGDMLGGFLEKVDVPFSVNGVAAFIAQKALEDEEFLQSCMEKIGRVKARLIDEFKVNNYIISETSPVVPIFVVGREEEVDLYRSFLRRNVLTTPGSGFPGLGVNFVRIRTPKEDESLLRVIREGVM
jgi:histidinol-phosphate aminotransferase